MKNILFLITTFCFITSAFGADEPAFIKNQPIDKSFVELNKRYENPKYKNAFGPAPEGCSEQTLKACKKSGLKCKCYRDPLMSIGGSAEDLRATVSNGDVIEFSHSIGGNDLNLLLKAMRPVEEFGDAAPNEILEGDSFSVGNKSFQVFVMFWKLAKGEVAAKVMCPLNKYAGAVTIGQLRECPMTFMNISRIQEFKRPKAKVSKEKY